MSVYAMGDLHGRYDLYQKVKKFLKPEDKVIFLGDAADRGPEGWKCIKAVYFDPQFTYLMGNHEHILFHAMKEYLGEETSAYPDGAITICHYNDGGSTLQDWINDGAKSFWIRRLSQLPRKIEYACKDGHKLILSHAGFQPTYEPTPWDLIWDREHLKYEWPEDEKFKNLILIHGHTPISYMLGDDWIPEEGILTYMNGHKVNIDMGAYLYGTICLLDLDTFDEHYFSV